MKERVIRVNMVWWKDSDSRQLNVLRQVEAKHMSHTADWESHVGQGPVLIHCSEWSSGYIYGYFQNNKKDKKRTWCPRVEVGMFLLNDSLNDFVKVKLLAQELCIIWQLFILTAKLMHL